MNAHWSLGVLIGLPVAALIAALCLAGVAGGLWWLRTYRSFDRDLGWILLGLSSVGLVGVLIVAGFAFFPYKADYHRWEPKSGTITALSNRFVGAGSGGTNQRIVVTLSGSPQQYACDDTRCALLKVGDPLSLSCKKAYQYASQPGYDCRFVRGGVA